MDHITFLSRAKLLIIKSKLLLCYYLEPVFNLQLLSCAFLRCYPFWACGFNVKVCELLIFKFNCFNKSYESAVLVPLITFFKLRISLLSCSSIFIIYCTRWFLLSKEAVENCFLMVLLIMLYNVNFGVDNNLELTNKLQVIE